MCEGSNFSTCWPTLNFIIAIQWVWSISLQFWFVFPQWSMILTELPVTWFWWFVYLFEVCVQILFPLWVIALLLSRKSSFLYVKVSYQIRLHFFSCSMDFFLLLLYGCPLASIFILKKSKFFSCAFDVTCKVALPNPRTRRYNYTFFYKVLQF